MPFARWRNNTKIRFRPTRRRYQSQRSTCFGRRTRDLSGDKCKWADSIYQRIWNMLRAFLRQRACGVRRGTFNWQGARSPGTQQVVALSSSDAQYMALAEIVKYVFYFRHVQRFVTPKVDDIPIQIFEEDNQGASKLANHQQPRQQ